MSSVLTEKTIPENWSIISLDECVEVLDNQRIPVNSRERDSRTENKDISELIPYYGATGQAGWIDDYIFDEELVLLGEDGAPFLEFSKNVSYIIKGKTWVNNHVHVLRVIKDVVTTKYLSHYLNIFDYKDYITGTTRYKLNQTQMKRIPVIIAPLDLQKKITDKLDELFSQLDVGLKSLKQTKLLLNHYRQAVLKAAMTGELTKKWRAKHLHELEPASVLLECVLLERRQKWEEKQLAKFQAQGKIPKDDSWKKKYQEPVTLDSETKNRLPEKWILVSLDQVSEIIMGLSPPGSTYNQEGKGYPLINGPVEFGSKPFSKTRKEKYTTQPKKLCEEGDLLLCVRGSTTGRMNISGFDSAIGRGVAAIRSHFYQYYLNYYIHYMQRQIYELGTGSTFPNVTLSKIKELAVPFAPFDEQKYIVSLLEKHLSVYDNIMVDIVKRIMTISILKQSLLKSAFEGKLIQDNSIKTLKSNIDEINKGETKILKSNQTTLNGWKTNE